MKIEFTPFTPEEVALVLIECGGRRYESRDNGRIAHVDYRVHVANEGYLTDEAGADKTFSASVDVASGELDAYECSDDFEDMCVDFADQVNRYLAELS